VARGLESRAAVRSACAPARSQRPPDRLRSKAPRVPPCSKHVRRTYHPPQPARLVLGIPFWFVAWTSHSFHIEASRRAGSINLSILDPAWEYPARCASRQDVCSAALRMGVRTSKISEVGQTGVSGSVLSQRSHRDVVIVKSPDPATCCFQAMGSPSPLS